VCGELVFWQIALNAEALLAIFIENDDGWRPDRFKPPEPGGILLDVNCDRNKVLFDERCELCVTV
jgi:hypothetical protein